MTTKTSIHQILISCRLLRACASRLAKRNHFNRIHCVRDVPTCDHLLSRTDNARAVIRTKHSVHVRSEVSLARC